MLRINNNDPRIEDIFMRLSFDPVLSTMTVDQVKSIAYQVIIMLDSGDLKANPNAVIRNGR